MPKPGVQLDEHSAMIVSKYFKTKEDFKNLELACKKFGDNIEKFRYNPIPLTDKKTRGLFPNLETQYIYSEEDTVFTDGKIKMYHIEKNVKFYKCPNVNALTSIKLYKMEKITGVMFADLKKIKKIILPDSVEEIGEGAFAGCASLKEITLPNSVKKIDLDAFAGCESLEEIIIPNSMKEIGRFAFRYCIGLEKITIPNSVKEIGEGAFDECANLQTVYMKGGEFHDALKQEIMDQCGHEVEFVRK